MSSGITMRWNGQGGLVCPLRGQSLESRLAAQRSVIRTRELQRKIDEQQGAAMCHTHGRERDGQPHHSRDPPGRRRWDMRVRRHPLAEDGTSCRRLPVRGPWAVGRDRTSTSWPTRHHSGRRPLPLVLRRCSCVQVCVRVRPRLQAAVVVSAVTLACLFLRVLRQGPPSRVHLSLCFPVTHVQRPRRLVWGLPRVRRITMQ